MNVANAWLRSSVALQSFPAPPFGIILASSCRPATCWSAMLPANSAHKRSSAPTSTPTAAKSGGFARGRHPALVRPPLVNRGHLRRGAPPSRHRDPAPTMVRPGHRANHTRVARSVLPCHPVGARLVCQLGTGASDSKLVFKTAAHIQRRACPSSSCTVDAPWSLHIRGRARPRQITSNRHQRPDRRSLLRRLNGQSRA